MAIKKLLSKGIEGHSPVGFKTDGDVLINKVVVKTIDADADVSLAWDIVLVDASEDDVVLTLPEPNFAAQVTFKTIDDSNGVTIETAGTSEIDGESTLALDTENDTATLVWSPEEGEWYIVSANIFVEEVG
jgi:hypothetical protein